MKNLWHTREIKTPEFFMSNTNLSLEQANLIAKALIERSTYTTSAKTQLFVVDQEPVEMLTPIKKRGRPAKTKSIEENHHEHQDDVAIDYSEGWIESAKRNRWSDDI